MNSLIMKSEVTKKNAIVFGIGIALLSAMGIFSIYQWVMWQRFNPGETSFEVILLVALIERVGAKYTYEMGEESLCITKCGIFGMQHYEVTYRDILGIYHYTPQLIGVMKFRRTFRLNSAIDGRDVWTLAYRFTGVSNKIENRRIYLKLSDEFLAALYDKMPDKVMNTEQKVVVANLKK